MTSTKSTTYGRGQLLILCLLALFLYLPSVLLVELYGGEEAGFAAIAREMISSGNFLQPHLQGNPVKVFPLYPWLICIFSFGKAPCLLSIRLPAVLSVWALALICGLTARRSKGDLAGFIAAAVVLCCVACLRIGYRAQTASLQAFFLALAWFSWYRYGPQEQRWHVAWGTALACLFLSIMSAGAGVIPLFYLPLLITRNPPKTLRQLQSAPHIIILAAFALLCFVYIKFICHQPFFPWDAVSFTLPDNRTVSFFGHPFNFGAKVFVYLLPWSLFAWAPFCLAMRQFEPVGTMCSFFRALVFVPLLLFLFWPGAAALWLLPTLAPMAVLIGIHFEITVNWYRRFFAWTMKLIYALAAAIAIFGAAFWGLLFLGNIELQSAILDEMQRDAVALFLALVCAILAILSIKQYRRAKKTPLWQALPLSCAALRVSLLLSITCVQSWSVGDRKRAGLSLAGRNRNETQAYTELAGLDPEIPLYLHGNYAYLTECYYLRRNIIRLMDFPAGLPDKQRQVYLLSQRQPAVPSRQWEALSPNVDMSQRRKWQWQLPNQDNQYKLSIARVPDEERSIQPPNYLRLYKGTLKNE
ncbi:MAG: hypothetical protein GX946_07785 [Oligosphaeraceae bacterium]|nr:hypothetical protein [Oligosphaeraceae bacterium]